MKKKTIMDVKLMTFVLAIFVQDISAAVQDTSLDLARSFEWLQDNFIRRSSNIQKIPPRYVLKMQSLQKGGDGVRNEKPVRLSSKANKKRKLQLEHKEIVRKITPVEVILDVEVANSKEKDDIEKILLSKLSRN